MPYQVHADPKPPYTCPKCGAKVSSESEPCPKCGCIGPMQHLEILLTAKTATGKKIAVPPPTVQQSTEHHKPAGTVSAMSQYRCPKCDARVKSASGKCPNRACGYSGTMKRQQTH